VLIITNISGVLTGHCFEVTLATCCTRGQFQQTYICFAFLGMNKMRSFFWQIAFGERQINLANFTLHIGQILLTQNVGEIEW